MQAGLLIFKEINQINHFNPPQTDRQLKADHVEVQHTAEIDQGLLISIFMDTVSDLHETRCGNCLLLSNSLILLFEYFH